MLQINWCNFYKFYRIREVGLRTKKTKVDYIIQKTKGVTKLIFLTNLASFISVNQLVKKKTSCDNFCFQHGIIWTMEGVQKTMCQLPIDISSQLQRPCQNLCLAGVISRIVFTENTLYICLYIRRVGRLVVSENKLRIVWLAMLARCYHYFFSKLTGGIVDTVNYTGGKTIIDRFHVCW